MISSLSIDNFKCFAHLRMELQALTLLTGFNGGGKSTAIQPLLLLAQGLRGAKAEGGLTLNGSLVRLGSVGDVLPLGASDKTIGIAVTAREETAEWSLQGAAGDRVLTVRGRGTGANRSRTWKDTVWPTQGRFADSELATALSSIVFISAVRGGTQDAFPYPDLSGLTHADVGTQGEFAAYWYDQHVDDEVDEVLRHPKESAGSFRKQLDAYLSDLFPGAQANVTALPQASSLNLQFRLSATGEWRRPANIGYGLTYAFPILVALLTARAGQVIVVDSPEAHLHPYAQSRMGRLLARFASKGKRIVVETHSDHLLNGVRLSVREQAIDHASVAVYFFADATSAQAQVSTPRLDKMGKFNVWPKGFFDQSEEDLAGLAGWN